VIGYLDLVLEFFELGPRAAILIEGRDRVRKLMGYIGILFKIIFVVT
jgi:hypothetical protein